VFAGSGADPVDEWEQLRDVVAMATGQRAASGTPGRSTITWCYPCGRGRPETAGRRTATKRADAAAAAVRRMNRQIDGQSPGVASWITMARRIMDASGPGVRVCHPSHEAPARARIPTAAATPDTVAVVTNRPADRGGVSP
jgi:hypothetical protein